MNHMERYMQFLDVRESLKKDEEYLKRMNQLLDWGRSLKVNQVNQGPVEILNHLYCENKDSLLSTKGSKSDANNITMMRRLKITHILNCAPNRKSSKESSLSSSQLSSSSSSSSSSYVSNNNNIINSCNSPKNPYNYHKNSSNNNTYHSLSQSPSLTSTSSSSSILLKQQQPQLSSLISSSSFNPYSQHDCFVSNYLELDAQDSDSFPILNTFYDRTKKFVDSAKKTNGRAFVHCELGMNRSITLCLAYLMEYDKLTLTSALRQIVLHRPNILTNEGFKRQLVLFAMERNLVPKD